MLGVCYYPEHWGIERVEEDFRRMKELGIEYVRIGEFAWSRIESERGKFNWDWLDKTLELAEKMGLKIVLGTPTATPPKWLIDEHPEILPVDKDGRVKNFGSRRHYCFSSPVYREEVKRIVTIIAKRYGKHPAVAGWQTDNEYGWGSTTRCYCSSCKKAFQKWLERKYEEDIEKLNKAWRTVFWSQEYRSFDEIELPNLTPADPNPSHLLDYYRFASDQVVEFNKLQVEIIREYSPGRFITHNFMGGFVDFDHYKLSRDLDFASWDNYPLGHTLVFLRMKGETKNPFDRVGHPDIISFSHDLYRGVGRGKFWVMEQGAGPVNWAPYNLWPAKGAVRLWTWQAFAHGAEVVSYFRWRQAPFAQEQMHSGLLAPDSVPSPGNHEVGQVFEELKNIDINEPVESEVALVFDYETAWVFSIQPHGEGVNYLDLVFRFYSALRRLGLNVDIVPPGSSLDGYKMVVVPSLAIVKEEVLDTFKKYDGLLVLGPRSGSKTETFQIPPEMPPGLLKEIIPVEVRQVESLGDNVETLVWNGKEYPVSIWREDVDPTITEVIARFKDGFGAIFRKENVFYLAFWPNGDFLVDFFEALSKESGIETKRLPEGVRIQRRGEYVFSFNFTSEEVDLEIPTKVQIVLGDQKIPPYGLLIWKENER
ncbi:MULTISPECIES: beta-galactosidase [unclassified Thermotoga]|uniref:beta-galactosidase n=1 Tax=unclassified Thermotoga TaxID=2631113 RepID=UPI000280E741|nr:MULTISPECIES: beta-galactosidase [unclassified Thermotoga]AIY87262.1 beta-galactosidase [Thermotoga sp. 2812B]EJX26376.1 beta-galactosidase [Thermotoga sp. EMP]